VNRSRDHSGECRRAAAALRIRPPYCSFQAHTSRSERFAARSWRVRPSSRSFASTTFWWRCGVVHAGDVEHLPTLHALPAQDDVADRLANRCPMVRTRSRWAAEIAIVNGSERPTPTSGPKTPCSSQRGYQCDSTRIGSYGAFERRRIPGTHTGFSGCREWVGTPREEPGTLAHAKKQAQQVTLAC